MNYIKNREVKNNSGFSILEVVISSAIIVAVVVFVVTSLQFYIHFSNLNSKSVVAATILEEGGEAVMFMRDKGWDENINSLILDTEYYIYWNGDDYLATTTPNIIKDSFYLIAVFEEIERDGNDSINESGNLDSDTRKVRVTAEMVSGEVSVTSEMLIHNSYEN
jgi:type II secretory pathway pseudopilin PulG